MLAITEPSAFAAGASAAAPEPSPQRQRSLARAARHDILQRLAPPLRHDMVVHLQSLGMMTEAITARLERGTLGGSDLQGSISKMNRLSRQAVQTCLEVCTWMQPAEDDTITVHEAVHECVRLLSTSLNFRGFELQVDSADVPFEVARGAIRFLLAAAVLTHADTAEAPGAIVLRAEASSTHAVVAVEFRPGPADAGALHETGDAPLAWPEIQALAADESVELARSGGHIVLRLPRAMVTTPLKMVPV